MAKSIMVQGTMSNVGKSLLAAGLCRIFRQDGYRVAPFKSQNMALNSYITADGLEMGRAQAMQAEAAGIEPDVRMNPILLKPTTDTGSQVIVRGEILGNMDAREYFSRKKGLLPLVLEAYRSLASEYDIIVIEGAGSPAEINLKADDIVNMGLARAVGAPVLLAGDIDRGGVFAQLLGTQMLLEPGEQALLRGFIINKFRGDKSLLDPGIRMLEERGGLPVVGVVPFLQLDLDDEDSLAPRLAQTNRPPAGKPVEIAVVRLPHLSNFTDFNVFSRIPEADLRYVSRPKALGDPDMVILPGTKNTMADLRWLRESGMAAAIEGLRHKGRVIFGICGGYQMLGQRISDPDGTEEGGFARGLGFLETETVFSKEKRRTRVRGRIEALPGILRSLGGMEIQGYEIHMGRTEHRDGQAAGRGPDDPGQTPFSVICADQTADKRDGSFCHLLYSQEALQKRPDADKRDGSFCHLLYSQEALQKRPDALMPVRASYCVSDGAARENIYGTYVHGIFDAPGIARRVVGCLAEAKGVAQAVPSDETPTVPSAVTPTVPSAPGEEQEEGSFRDASDYKNTQYDLLAETLREHLDIPKIYEILQL